MKQFMKTYRLAIRPQSPIHCGCGEDYDPTAYVIADGALYPFDGPKVLTQFPAMRDDVMRALRGDDPKAIIAWLERYYSNHAEAITAQAAGKIPVTPDVEDYYYDGDASNRYFAIERTAHRPDGAAYIPGSSIKGAIRTALLNALPSGLSHRAEEMKDLIAKANDAGKQAREKTHFGKERPLKGGELEKELGFWGVAKLRSYYGPNGQKHHGKPDPLSRIHIGDSEASGKDDRTICYALNRKAIRDEPGAATAQGIARTSPVASNLFAALEVISDKCQPKFVSQLTLRDKPVDGRGRPLNPDDDGKAFTVAEIALACNRFCHKLLSDEIAILERCGYSSPSWIEYAKGMRAQMERFIAAPQAANGFFLRLGKHSGAESLTIEGFRNLKTHPRRQQYADKPTTLWLCASARKDVANMIPFGWALATFKELP